MVAGSSGIGAYGTSWPSCQPRPSVHLIVTMWSVKWRPNPGFARIASRSAAGSGWADGLSSIVGVVMGACPSPVVVTGRAHARTAFRPVLGRPSIPSYRGSAFDYRVGSRGGRNRGDCGPGLMVAPGGDMGEAAG